MAFDSIVKSAFDGAVTSLSIADGTGTPKTATARYDRGDFSVDGLVQGLRETTAYETRGKLVTVRKTGRVYPTFSFSMMFTEFAEGDAGTLMELIHGATTTTSAMQSRVTTITDSDAVGFDITHTIEGTDFGRGSDETVVMTDCVFTTVRYEEGDPSVLTLEGTCYGTVTAGGITISE